MLINKKTLEYLAELSRIELDKKHEEKMLEDLQNILGHFDELKEVDTEGVEPLAGGTVETNVFRNDDGFNNQPPASDLIDAFPDKEGDFLKVPPVFE
ncbi:MAG: Asp-tRNA(Asn)/Glu-tRNA(Gln) amidotransferase subunit GatC [Candidatus Paceibacterota bacterium]